MEQTDKSKMRKPYTITKQRERWSDAEHLKMLEALRLHGRAWRKIEEFVGTKTSIQIRSHAQKFFTKLERHKECGSLSEECMLGASIPPPRPKRRPIKPPHCQRMEYSGSANGGDTSCLYPSQFGTPTATTSSGQAGHSMGPFHLQRHPDEHAFVRHESPCCDVSDATFAAVAAAASAAAAAAAAAVIAAAGHHVQLHLPQGLSFFGMPPSSLSPHAPPRNCALEGFVHANGLAVAGAQYRWQAGVPPGERALQLRGALAEATATTEGCNDDDDDMCDRDVSTSEDASGRDDDEDGRGRDSDGDSACSRETNDGGGVDGHDAVEFGGTAADGLHGVDEDAGAVVVLQQQAGHRPAMSRLPWRYAQRADAPMASGLDARRKRSATEDATMVQIVKKVAHGETHRNGLRGSELPMSPDARRKALGGAGPSSLECDEVMRCDGSSGDDVIPHDGSSGDDVMPCDGSSGDDVMRRDGSSGDDDVTNCGQGGSGKAEGSDPDGSGTRNDARDPNSSDDGGRGGGRSGDACGNASDDNVVDGGSGNAQDDVADVDGSGGDVGCDGSRTLDNNLPMTGPDAHLFASPTHARSKHHSDKVDAQPAATAAPIRGGGTTTVKATTYCSQRGPPNSGMTMMKVTTSGSQREARSGGTTTMKAASGSQRGARSIGTPTMKAASGSQRGARSGGTLTMKTASGSRRGVGSGGQAWSRDVAQSAGAGTAAQPSSGMRTGGVSGVSQRSLRTTTTSVGDGQLTVRDEDRGRQLRRADSQQQTEVSAKSDLSAVQSLLLALQQQSSSFSPYMAPPPALVGAQSALFGAAQPPSSAAHHDFSVSLHPPHCDLLASAQALHHHSLAAERPPLHHIGGCSSSAALRLPVLFPSAPPPPLFPNLPLRSPMVGGAPPVPLVPPMFGALDHHQASLAAALAAAAAAPSLQCSLPPAPPPMPLAFGLPLPPPFVGCQVPGLLRPESFSGVPPPLLAPPLHRGVPPPHVGVLPVHFRAPPAFMDVPPAFGAPFQMAPHLIQHAPLDGGGGLRSAALPMAPPPPMPALTRQQHHPAGDAAQLLALAALEREVRIQRALGFRG